VCIENVSFVIIAKNEGQILEKVMDAICNIDRKNCEIICVDSDSTDNTLTIFKKYASQSNDIQVYLIKGDINAACARNVGIKYSIKKYIFFIDGDVVVDEMFIKKGVNYLENQKNVGGVVGYLKEYQYSNHELNIVQNIVYRNKCNAEMEVLLTGGIILMKKSVIDKVGFFDERLSFHEDWDFCLSVKTKGFNIVNIAIKMGEHFTVPYRNISRMINSILSKEAMYSGLILKKHVRNTNYLRNIFIHDYGLYGGSCIVLLAIIGISIKSQIIISLTVSIFLLDIIIGLKKEKNNLLGRIVQHYLSFWQILYGFIFFYPKKKRKIQTYIQ